MNSKETPLKDLQVSCKQIYIESELELLLPGNCYIGSIRMIISGSVNYPAAMVLAIVPTVMIIH